MFEDESFIVVAKKTILALWVTRQKTWPGLVLLGVGLLVVIASLLYLVWPTQVQSSSSPPVQTHLTSFKSETTSLYVDVSGAVLQPGLYQVQTGDRVATALARAGGIGQQADLIYVSKTLNLAKKVEDGDKIYVPFSGEVADLSATSGSQSPAVTTNLVALNTATSAQLDSLPGIGAVRAEEITNNRPYANLQELVDKKILPQNIFDEVRDFLTL